MNRLKQIERKGHVRYALNSLAPVTHSSVMLCIALVAGASLIAVPPPNGTVLDIFSLRTGSTAEKLGNAKDLVGQVGTHSPALSLCLTPEFHGADL
ncbi:MAG: hypothetical protein H7Y39_02350 [Nitrospiraceae bacterium]|nr:hypothetical protein [Nitrospiraceae bacterium]